MTTAISPAIAGIATAADVDRAVAALTLAFSTDPVARWMYAGDPCAYLTHFPHFVRAFGGKAFAAGTAFGAEDGSGVALWLPPGMHVDGAAVDALLERTLAPERHATMGATFDQMVQYHPEVPHWYLPLLGVDNAHQNQGYGAMLLEHALRQCDRPADGASRSERSGPPGPLATSAILPPDAAVLSASGPMRFARRTAR